jgi:hypothetical protein
MCDATCTPAWIIVDENLRGYADYFTMLYNEEAQGSDILRSGDNIGGPKPEEAQPV